MVAGQAVSRRAVATELVAPDAKGPQPVCDAARPMDPHSSQTLHLAQNAQFVFRAESETPQVQVGSGQIGIQIGKFTSVLIRFQF